ncbi:MAG: imidazole glycerol phosphate synthase subunit HisH [Acidimicrobiales bacterium]
MIAVLDYGIGNLRSAQRALRQVGADAVLATTPEEAEGADGFVLPGVGAFGASRTALARTGLDRVAVAAIEAGLPLLGVCVGLQLLYEGSEEDPGVEGLGVLSGRSIALSPTEKRPQMQWNLVTPLPTASYSRLIASLPPAPWVYFVHSYAPELTDDAVASCDYGGPVVAAVERGALWGTQFHPEKSGTVGLALLAAFVRACSEPVVRADCADPVTADPGARATRAEPAGLMRS